MSEFIGFFKDIDGAFSIALFVMIWGFIYFEIRAWFRRCRQRAQYEQVPFFDVFSKKKLEARRFARGQYVADMLMERFKNISSMGIKKVSWDTRSRHCYLDIELSNPTPGGMSGVYVTLESFHADIASRMAGVELVFQDGSLRVLVPVERSLDGALSPDGMVQNLSLLLVESERLVKEHFAKENTKLETKAQWEGL